MKYVSVVAVLGLALLAASCMGDRSERRGRMPGPGPQPEYHPAGDKMLKYDANKDGSVTRAELDAGLRAEFAAADTNHDGVLDPDEVRVVNAARIQSEGTTASPLIDWNQDGHVDFEEFAAGPRTLFGQLDRNGDGVLSPDELHPGHRTHKPARGLPVGAPSPL
jgi:Ca2+-binding EF-hand superfamily protein